MADFTEKTIFVYDSLLWKLESYVSLIMYVMHFTILFNFCAHADYLWKGRVFHLIHLDGVLNFSRYVTIRNRISFRSFYRIFQFRKMMLIVGFSVVR